MGSLLHWGIEAVAGAGAQHNHQEVQDTSSSRHFEFGCVRSTLIMVTNGGDTEDCRSGDNQGGGRKKAVRELVLFHSTCNRSVKDRKLVLSSTDGSTIFENNVVEEKRQCRCEKAQTLW